MTFRIIALRLLALACALLLAGTALPAAAQASPQQKILRYAFPVAETGFDPIQLTDLYSRIVTAHIFDGLYKYDYLARPFRIEPNTADGMPEVSPDFRVWTVKVRPGIYFADDPAFKNKNRELTAEDYVYSFKRAFDPRWKSPTYATLAELKIVGIAPLREAVLKQKKPFDYDAVVPGLRTLDRYTIRFEFETPQPRFIQTLTSGDLYGAVAREVVEAYGDKMMEKPVGTGPFRLVEWRRSSRLVLERNPNFREVIYDAEPNADDAEGQALVQRFAGKRLPMIDRVEISIIEEQQPRWLSFLNKQQDLLYGLPAEFINLAIPNGKLAPNLARQGVQMLRVPGSDITLTVFNMEDPVVGGYTPERVALRRAISLATNIDQEIRLIWRGQAVPAQAPLNPMTFGFDPKLKSENGEYNPARAKALLDLFGYVDRDGDGLREQPDGSPLVLRYNTQPDQNSRQRDELRRKDMAAIGLRTEFMTAKWPENLKSVRAGKYMIWGVGSSSAAPDGQPALYRSYTGHIGGQNLARFRNDDFDRIFEKISNLPDGAERLALFHEAKRIVLAYAPYKMHVHRILTDLAHPWVSGFRRAPYWLDWWQYVDVDVDAREKVTR
jgi:ABC-type transport system substrate-binding protein